MTSKSSSSFAPGSWKQIFRGHRLQYPRRDVSRIEKRALEKLRAKMDDES